MNSIARIFKRLFGRPPTPSARQEFLARGYDPKNFTPDKVGICPLCVAEGRCTDSDEYFAYINRHPVGTRLDCLKCGIGFTGMKL